MLDLCYSSVGSIFSEKAENVKLLWFWNIESAQIFWWLCVKSGLENIACRKKMGLEKKWTGKKGAGKKGVPKQKQAEKNWAGKKCSWKKNGTEQKRGWKKCVPEKSGVWRKTGNGIILGISTTKMGIDMKTKFDPQYQVIIEPVLKRDNSISCLAVNRKWNYFRHFDYQNGYGHENQS